MTTLLIGEEAPPVRLAPLELSDDQFFDFCAQNSEHHIERTAEGAVVIMPGTGAETGNRNASITAQLYLWSARDGRGVSFNSRAIFLLPNTAMRSPDACWVARSRLTGFTKREKERFLPLCPEFVIELTSPSDRFPQVRKKMEEWMANGCQLGWIIHPPKREVHVYRSGGVEALRGIGDVRGEGPVEGFVLDLKPIWDPGW
jgi:Uma2 family endonuclease